jgi:carboxyl-terminal processing protease
MKEEKKIVYSSLVFLAVVLFTGWLLVAISWAERKGSGLNYEQLLIIGEVIGKIEGNFIDEIDSQNLIDGALKGMVKSLDDAHSSFLTAEDYKLMQEDTRGKFGGLGIVITIKDEVLTIISPIEDTPAYKAGLKAGDKIVKIEDVSTQGITLLEAVNKLRGKPGSEVKITILRGENVLKDYTIIREIIKVDTVKDIKVLSSQIGYCRITDFREETARELELCLKGLEQKNIKGLILDLRGNPGGLLDVAVGVADKFIEKGKMIVYTQSRKRRRDFKAKERKHGDYPMVVLMNEGSASGSEIVAGALRDWKRAILVGTKSFGKGSVQTMISLKNKSALRLTTARYYTPKGECIDKKGIMPDIEVKLDQERIIAAMKEKEEKKEKEKEKVFWDEDNKKKEEKGKELSDADQIPKYDTQLKQAVNILKAIIFMKKSEKKGPKS